MSEHFLRILRALVVLAVMVHSVQSVRCGQEIPGAPQTKPVAIVGATVHTITQGTIQRGTVLFDNGVVVAVGTNVQIPQGAVVVKADGKHVYPGFIAANTTLGLNEIEAVRATRDAAEVGSVNPNARAEVAYDPDSDIIPTVRSNGVLIAHVVPEGGVVSGLSSVMRLDGWTREDIAIKPRAGIVMHWPRMTVNRAWWERRSAEEQISESLKQVEEIRTLFREARAYARMEEAGLDTSKRNLKLEAMRGLFDGDLPLIVVAGERQQIEAALDLAQDFDLSLIIMGGAEAPLVAERLRQNNVPVILQPVNSLPSREEDNYDAAYTLPLRLDVSGVDYCISDRGFWQVRSLPFQAGTAVAYGLSEEKALAAITIAPARILGIADKYGSIEAGKSATLFICNGNALDVRGNIVEQAWIDGRSVDLSNRHTRLSEKYRERYKR